MSLTCLSSPFQPASSPPTELTEVLSGPVSSSCQALILPNQTKCPAAVQRRTIFFPTRLRREIALSSIRIIKAISSVSREAGPFHFQPEGKPSEPTRYGLVQPVFKYNRVPRQAGNLESVVCNYPSLYIALQLTPPTL